MSADALRTELRERLEQHGVAEKLQQSVASALTHKAAGESVELQSLIAANLLEDSAVGKALPGLAHALRTMATKMPEDPTEWLCARLKASRPVVVREYTESVLKAHVMKCDEFENIHLLKTERLHPQAWNFRRTDAALPVFGSGQCHLLLIFHSHRYSGEDVPVPLSVFEVMAPPLVPDVTSTAAARIVTVSSHVTRKM